MATILSSDGLEYDICYCLFRNQLDLQSLETERLHHSLFGGSRPVPLDPPKSALDSLEIPIRTDYQTAANPVYNGVGETTVKKSVEFKLDTPRWELASMGTTRKLFH